MAKIRTTVETDNALQGASADLRAEMRRLREDVAGASELIFASHALVRSGRMARGITSRAVGDTMLVTAHAANPQTGYDYVGTTRWGHRVRWIVPTRAKMLRFQPRKGGAFIFRARVRGFRPKSDWATDALPEVRAEADRQLASFGRGFTARIL